MRTSVMLLTIALALGRGGGVSAANDSAASEFGEREKNFVDQVAARDFAEIELSKLIKVKSRSAAVRHLARTILADDNANYDRLFKLCLRRHYAIAPQLDERHRELLQQVRAARSGATLGRKYIDTLLVDQASADASLTGLAEQPLPSDIEQFASDTAQMIARHEQLARALASK